MLCPPSNHNETHHDAEPLGQKSGIVDEFNKKQRWRDETAEEKKTGEGEERRIGKERKGNQRRGKEGRRGGEQWQR